MSTLSSHKAEIADATGASVARSPVHRWKNALIALCICVVWIFFWHWPTAAAMVSVWYRSETFTHGFVVPPISIWLIWSQRASLAQLVPRVSPPMLGLLAASQFAWLLGDLVAVNSLTQLALVATLVLAVIAILGTQVAKAIAFPLAFLFFTVPIGEFIIPQMMDWTAKFAVIALRLTGIPVYQEGLQFVIPSGSWSVVEACSGVRYLIASFVVGTLFAYLNYTSLSRRITFCVVAILVPILANWIRAYMIVMLGHLSGNKLAVGVDHLIYGWVFFGIVITLMFVIGARWSEDPVAVPVRPESAIGQPSGALPLSIVTLSAMGIVVMPLLANAVIAARQATATPVLTLPASAGAGSGWAPGENFTSWQPLFRNPAVSLRANFEKAGRRAGVVVAYYRNQSYSSKLVTSTNVLVESGDKSWARTGSGMRTVALAGTSVTVRTTELRGIPADRLLVGQWYWVNGQLTASDFRAKILGAISRLLGKGDDSAAIVIYVPVAAEGEGGAELEAFAAALWPDLERALIQAESTR